MQPRRVIFQRDRSTWLAYFLLAFYAYFLNILGPITPFLMEEEQLTYTTSSLHFTAFAVGILIVGLAGHSLIERIGRWQSLWVGAFGISLGALLLVSVKSPLVTIPACFLMGLIGSTILAVVPSALSDQHGEFRSVALAEANVTASLISTLAPLVVGWTAGTLFGWRISLYAAAGLPVLLLIFFWTARPKGQAVVGSASPSNHDRHKKLPWVFWVYWTALVMAVSVEFCMVFWSADYLEKVLGLKTAAAAQSVSLFLAGMILGRLVGSVLVRKLRAERVVYLSILTAAGGFLLYWAASNPIAGLPGLFLSGLGTASLYPLILSLAIGSAGSQTVQAGSRTTLASGTAILLLPLMLGRLADEVGIWWAYSIILLLLMAAFMLIQAAGRISPSLPAVQQNPPG
jgi:fucose permease